MKLFALVVLLTGCAKPFVRHRREAEVCERDSQVGALCSKATLYMMSDGSVRWLP